MPTESANPSPPEIPPETVAPTPPPELAVYVTAFSPENIARVKAERGEEPGMEWIIERLGMSDAVDGIDSPGGLGGSLVVALLRLPAAARYDLSRAHSFEIVNFAGNVAEWLKGQGDPDGMEIVSELIAPEILAALNWMAVNQPAKLIKLADMPLH